MRIEAARMAGNELIFTTKDAEARRLAYDFKPGEYELRKITKKRSIDANNFCWNLASQIAEVVRLPKETIYRRNIREVGVYTPLPIKAEAVGEFRRIWEHRGIGWFVDVVDDSKIPGYKLCFAYHGSSVYDTAQMSRLIDSLIQDAESVGIVCISEREKSLLLDRWEQ